MIITGRELKELKELRPIFQDDIRKEFQAITINGFAVSGVGRFKIDDDIVFVCDKEDRELARIGINKLEHVEINKEFGDYRFVLK